MPTISLGHSEKLMICTTYYSMAGNCDSQKDSLTLYQIYLFNTLKEWDKGQRSVVVEFASRISVQKVHFQQPSTFRRVIFSGIMQMVIV